MPNAIFDPTAVEAFLRVVESGRVTEITQRDSRAREGAPRELTARTLQPVEVLPAAGT